MSVGQCLVQPPQDAGPFVSASLVEDSLKEGDLTRADEDTRPA